MGNLCDPPSKDKSSLQQSQYTKMGAKKQLPADIPSIPCQPQPYSTIQENNHKKRVGLDDFIMLETVGKVYIKYQQGAFGKVYKVKKKDNNKIYAMKQIQKSKIFEHQLEGNAVIERNVLKNSKHPFIVQLKYSFQTPGKIYFVMEYVAGGEFYKILQKANGLPEKVVKYITAEVVLALQYLNNDLKVIYRDLKPENILLTQTGHVKLTDFGLATLRKDKDAKTFTVAGTPEYLAPEIISRQGHSFEVDLWTLGILIYEMINGYPPFSHPERSVHKIQQLITLNQPNYPATMSQEAQDLVKKLLKTNPQERLGYKSYEEIRTHPFFGDIKWEDLFNLRIKSPLKTYAEETTRKNDQPKVNLTQNNIHDTYREGGSLTGHIAGITYVEGSSNTLNQRLQ